MDWSNKEAKKAYKREWYRRRMGSRKVLPQDVYDDLPSLAGSLGVDLDVTQVTGFNEEPGEDGFLTFLMETETD